MSEKLGFFAETFSEEGYSLVRLGYRDADPAKCAEAVISPSQGSNLLRFVYGGHKIIDASPKMIPERIFAGTPVLFPTPNRVRNARYAYDGRTYAQVKRGKPIMLHGLVHNEPWNAGEPHAGADGAALNTWIDIAEGNDLYEGFPFLCRLAVEFTLTRSSVKVSYAVTNRGGKPLPFGFALHPYFEKLAGDDGTIVTIPADDVMDATADLLPTGRLIDVGCTIYDLRRGLPVGKTDMDHVFTGIAPGAFATVDYQTLGFKVVLKATEDFTHLVFYSPKGAPFFCLENQTCSTDAHNLHDRGLIKESHLMVAVPGETIGGYVEFSIEKA